MHPLRLTELFLGDLTRYVPHGPGPAVYHLVASGGRAPWQLTVFSRVLPRVALALLPVAGRRRRIAGRLALLAGACPVAGPGALRGLYRSAWWALPRFDAFRYPEKLLPYAQVPPWRSWRGSPSPPRCAGHDRPPRVTLGLGVALALVAALPCLLPSTSADPALDGRGSPGRGTAPQ